MTTTADYINALSRDRVALINSVHNITGHSHYNNTKFTTVINTFENELPSTVVDHYLEGPLFCGFSFGVGSGGLTLTTYATPINLVEDTRALANVSMFRNLASMFRGASTLVDIDVSNWQTAKVTNMAYTFYQCSSLTTLNLNSWRTSQVTCMNDMFYNCKNLTSLNISKWQTNNLEYATYMFNNCTNLTSVSFPNLTTTSAQYEFYGICANPSARTIDLSSLTNAGPRSFYQACNGNTNLTSIDFSSLATVTGHLSFYQAFTGCTGLTSMSFPSLTQIGDATSTGTNCQHFSSAFSGCTGLTTLTFPELTAIYCNGANNANNGSFTNNETITKMYFPKLSEISYAPAYTGSSTTVTSACKYIFSGCTALTEIHFGAANENAIKATAGWSTLWGRGAGNATVYFDL